MRRTVAIVIGVPAVIAVVTTLAQWWPATIAIERLADSHGTYSVRAAITVTLVGLLLIVLVAVLAIRIVVSLVRRSRAPGASRPIK